MSHLQLDGKRILLTGGCGALGQYIVKTLSDHGAHVLVNDIVTDDKAQQGFEAHNVNLDNVDYYRADITQENAVDELITSFSDDDVPDTVCCHAGMSLATPIEEYPVTQFDALFNLNLRAAFLVARAVTKRWLARNQKGHLIFTSSWVQDVPWPHITPYNASKAALKTLMRGFARELAPKGIRANAIAPGIVNVGMAKKQYETEPDYRKRANKAVPLGYLQPPESVANTFLFLCSDMANYMTGSVLLVDGGASLYPLDEDDL
ncbi:MAG: SDR family NAD(P)-dependent oxidoreductase [Deinococcota bacterium]